MHKPILPPPTPTHTLTHAHTDTPTNTHTLYTHRTSLPLLTVHWPLAAALLVAALIMGGNCSCHQPHLMMSLCPHSQLVLRRGRRTEGRKRRISKTWMLWQVLEHYSMYVCPTYTSVPNPSVIKISSLSSYFIDTSHPQMPETSMVLTDHLQPSYHQGFPTVGPFGKWC